MLLYFYLKVFSLCFLFILLLSSTLTSILALRRKIFTDPCLGAANLKMAAIAKKHNSAAKLPGSGGAVIGLCRNQEAFPELQALHL